MRLRVVAGLVLCGLIVPGSTAQPAPAPAGVQKPAFEVATVRPSEPLDFGKMRALAQSGNLPKFGPQIDGLRAEYKRMPLKLLIARAYEVQPFQVTVPKDISTQMFDIVARMPEGSTKADEPKMLRTLLEERFKLDAKKVTGDQTVYALVVGKDGPKLKESSIIAGPLDPNAELKPGETKIDGPFGPAILKQNPDGSSAWYMGERGSFRQRFDFANNTMQLDGTALTMQGLAETLSLLSTGSSGGSGRPVIDMTGLKGHYDLTLELSLSAMGPPPPPGSAATAEASLPAGSLGLEESVQKVGLKLEPRKAPIEQVMVSHVEKMPTEN